MTPVYDYIIHAYGVYSRKNDEGAFAFVVCDGEDKISFERAYKIQHETNNRAQLKAIIAALYQLPKPYAKNILVVSSSQYALNSLFSGWARNSNHDLFDVYEKIQKERDFNIEWCWVQGHSEEDHLNALCDRLCKDVLGYDANAEFSFFKKNRK